LIAKACVKKYKITLTLLQG